MNARDTELLQKRLALARIIRERTRLLPAMAYQPHEVCRRGPRAGRPSGQILFHQSKHPARIVASGNGWGGTMAMGCEVDAWARGTNRWQVTPPPPTLTFWFAPLKAQFEALWMKLLKPKVFGPTVRKRRDDMGTFIEWTNGSRMYVGSYETSWKSFQGPEPDLVAFDEQPPVALWNEMQQRRRGSGMAKTRFICKATQTGGWSWMGDVIYKPWLERHKAEGLDEEASVLAQLDRYFWLWPFGGIHDNPFADEETIREYEERVWPSAKERKVRLYGGFESFAGDPVFDAAALEWYAAQQARWAEEYGGELAGFFSIA